MEVVAAGVVDVSGSALEADDDFERLYEVHAAQALRFASMLAGSQARGEDVAAAAMVKVLRRWRRGGIEQFWPYLRVAILNEFRSELRRDRTVGGDTDVADEAGFDQVIADRAALLSALALLPATQRAAIALRYLEDLSEVTVADLLGCKVGTVKSSVSRGLASLRAQLGEARS